MAQAIDSNLISQLGLSDSTTKRKPSDKLGQSDFLKLMTTQLRNQDAMQASSQVGKTVVAPAESVSYTGKHAVQGAVQLDAAADNVALGIFDQSGQLIRKIDLGPQRSGAVPFSWDGLAGDGSVVPAGIYQLKAESVVAGKASAANTLVAEPVAAVTLATAGQPMAITLAGGSTVAMSDIKQIM